MYLINEIRTYIYSTVTEGLNLIQTGLNGHAPNYFNPFRIGRVGGCVTDGLIKHLPLGFICAVTV